MPDFRFPPFSGYLTQSQRTAAKRSKLHPQHHRINSTGALQDLSISLVVEPSTKARMREWP